MDQLSSHEKIILQKIVKNDSFEVLQKIASILLIQWNQGNLVGETEFETVKNAIGREERKQALTRFLKVVEEVSNG